MRYILAAVVLLAVGCSAAAEEQREPTLAPFGQDIMIDALESRIIELEARIDRMEGGPLGWSSVEECLSAMKDLPVGIRSHASIAPLNHDQTYLEVACWESRAGMYLGRDRWAEGYARLTPLERATVDKARLIKLEGEAR